MKTFIHICSLIILALAGCERHSSSDERIKVIENAQSIQSNSTSHRQQAKDTLIYTNSCYFTDLSKSYNINVKNSIRAKDTNDILPKYKIRVSIEDKNSGKEIQVFQIYPQIMYEDFIKDCRTSTSYITGVNARAEHGDGYFGELVVADLNADSLEDLAVINDAGGNSGPTYNFYLQTAQHTFELDKFLTDSMQFFPTEIKPDARMLVTYGHSSAYASCQHKYIYDSRHKTWKEVSRRIVDDQHPAE